MPVPQGYQQQQVSQQRQGFSCFDKLKMGFLMGAGLRGREAFRQIGKVAAQMGGSFGVFMTVAQGIRC
uniref:Reactive oxygen species modulator 1 n=1 Tax=Meloidogyne floridensis TaxID=298350 RepID=A0A915NPX5_9BILA